MFWRSDGPDGCAEGGGPIAPDFASKSEGGPPAVEGGGSIVLEYNGIDRRGLTSAEEPDCI